MRLQLALNVSNLEESSRSTRTCLMPSPQRSSPDTPTSPSKTTAQAGAFRGGRQSSRWHDQPPRRRDETADEVTSAQERLATLKPRPDPDRRYGMLLCRGRNLGVRSRRLALGVVREDRRYRIDRDGHVGHQNLLPGVDRLA